MKKNILATKRPWNWKVFRTLGLVVPAAFAILPYSIHLQNAYNQQDITTRFGWEIIMINTLVNSLLIVSWEELVWRWQIVLGLEYRLWKGGSGVNPFHPVSAM